MRNLFFFFISSLALTQVACQEKGVETEHGHRLINHTNNEGAKAQPGETVLVSVDTWIGDSLMGSTTKDVGGPREYRLPTREQIGSGRAPSLFDAAILMAEGDSATLIETIDSSKLQFLPPALKDEREIRYEIVLHDIISPEDKQKEMDAVMARYPSVRTKMETLVADYKAGKLADKITTTESGLKMIIEDKGSGAAYPQGSRVKAHYYGVLPNGTMFDNSFERGEPLEFALGMGQMIPGFDEGISNLNKGGKAVLFLPPALAYGEQGTPDGTIPPNTEIIFYVEAQ